VVDTAVSGRETPEDPVRPGAVSALLAELAASPEVSLAEAWSSRLAPGTVLGRFEILRELGRGGFGVVYEARDRELGRLVAFKTVRRSRSAWPEDERLHREAEAAARLSHPNIVALHDAGVCEHGPFLIFELLQGRTLAERLQMGPLPVPEGLRVATAVARGMAHAHAKGVVHRDLKPDNVFLCDDGGVKILDLGLAHAFGQRTEAGGTPLFMAPEQARGAPEDERTDVFALGVILHLMLSGNLPFAVGGARSLRGHRTPPRLSLPEVPALPDLVARMIARDPVSRPRDAGEVLAALEALGPEIERAHPISPSGALARQRWRSAWLVGAGLLVGVVAGGVVGAFARRDARRAALEATVVAPGRLTVAVADFANETGDRELDALSGLLITSLEQSRRLQVLTRLRMLDLARQAGHAAPERIDATVGRDVGRRAAARTLLLPSIRRFEDVYVVDVHAVDPGSDEILFTVRERAATRVGIPEALDRVSERVRRALREDRADVEGKRVAVGRAVTKSLDAYRHYFVAQHLASTSFQADRALAEYRLALQADPDFALPHIQIALLSAWHEVPGEDPEVHLAAAAARADELPDKERRLLPIAQAYIARRFDEAQPLLRELVDAYPLDKEVLYVAGEALWHGSSPHGPLEAVALFRRALDLDPAYLVASVHLIQWLGRFGPAEEGVSRARRAAQIAPGPMAHATLARALAFVGDAPGALSTAREAAAAGGGQHFESAYALAEILFATGEHGAGEVEIRRWMAPSTPAGDRRIAAEFLPVLLAAEGRRREALASLDELSAIECGEDCDYHEGLLRVHVALAGGDRAGALRALRRWRPREPDVAAGHAWLWAWLGDGAAGAMHARRLAPGSRWERWHAGAEALRRGRVDDARQILEEVSRQDPSAEPLFLLGQAHAEAGRHGEAFRAFDAIAGLHPYYAPHWQASLQPWSLLLASRSLERLGRRDEARARLDRLLALWRSADIDLPLLADARSMRARLDARAR